ncbi:hypothetical protein TURU_129069 [Turdus rufiventris]|nr:hypothetical protein TURU_129069 [Turdus rufiventris]
MKYGPETGLSQPVCDVVKSDGMNHPWLGQWDWVHLSKFASNTKLWGTVNTLEGSNATLKNVDRLERLACANLMKFSKAKCRVLPLGWGNPKHKYKLGGE